jgi:23S rRNA pseudouridine1911/1915/1917 synthase
MPAAMSIVRVTIPADSAGLRLDRALALALPALSRERLKALIGQGQVTGPGGAAWRDPARRVAGGEALAVAVPAPAPAAAPAQPIPLSIAFEDEHLIVIDKPAGLVVHPACGHADGTLVNALLHHCAGRLSGIGGVARPGIVHRIDKDTSGLMVAAKTDPAHEGLARQFKAHTVERLYRAVALGHPAPAAGRVESWLARDPRDRRRVVSVEQGQGKYAVTHWRVVERLAGATLIEARLETGRTHQVRVHMASIGHPLLGDAIYGRGPARALGARHGLARQALHAATLGFVHPATGERLRFESPLPRDMMDLLAALAPQSGRT